MLLAAHHLHGGVGVDRDYPLYRYFLLAKQHGARPRLRDAHADAPGRAHRRHARRLTPRVARRLARRRRSGPAVAIVLLVVALAASGAWLWFRLHARLELDQRDAIGSRPGRCWAVAVVAVLVAIVDRIHGVAHGVVASVGVFGGVVGAVLTGSARCRGTSSRCRRRRAGRGTRRGVGAAYGDQVKFVIAGGRQISPSTYECGRTRTSGSPGSCSLARRAGVAAHASSTRAEAVVARVSS